MVWGCGTAAVLRAPEAIVSCMRDALETRFGCHPFRCNWNRNQPAGMCGAVGDLSSADVFGCVSKTHQIVWPTSSCYDERGRGAGVRCAVAINCSNNMTYRNMVEFNLNYPTSTYKPINSHGDLQIVSHVEPWNDKISAMLLDFVIAADSDLSLPFCDNKSCLAPHVRQSQRQYGVRERLKWDECNFISRVFLLNLPFCL